MYRDESRPSTVCFFTKDGSELLLLFDLLFIKDFPELVQCIACVSAESRDVLIRVFAYVNTPRGNGSLACACCIALRGGKSNPWRIECTELCVLLNHLYITYKEIYNLIEFFIEFFFG